jgi:hypothetical protein
MHPWLQVGLVCGLTYGVLEYYKPSMLFDEKTGQPKSDMLTPVSLAAAAGIMFYMLKVRGKTAEFSALEVGGMNLSELDGYSGAGATMPGAIPSSGASILDVPPPDTFSLQ